MSSINNFGQTHWVKLRIKFKDISIGNRETWCITSQNILYAKHLDHGWSPVPALPAGKVPASIRIGNDDTIFCVSSDHNLYRFNQYNRTWIHITDGINGVALSHNGYCFVSTTSGRLRKYLGEYRFHDVTFAYKDRTYTPVQFDASDDNFLFIINQHQNLFTNHGEKSNVIDEMHYGGLRFSFTSYSDMKGVSALSFNDIMFFTEQNDIYTYKGDYTIRKNTKQERYYNETANEWQFREIEGNIQRIVHDDKRNCYLSVTDSNGDYHCYQMISVEDHNF